MKNNHKKLLGSLFVGACAAGDAFVFFRDEKLANTQNSLRVL